MNKTRPLFVWVFIAATQMLPVAVMAQSATASITGTVNDESEAAVAGAAIRVVNTQTSEVRQAETNASGAYTLPLLPIGTYTVSAEKQGFKTAERAGVKLSITDVARVDLTLVVGSTSETVTVASSNVLLNSESAEVATTVSQRSISDLPLNGRNFQQLLLLDGTSYSTQGTVIGEFRGSQTLPDGGIVGVGGSRQDNNGFTIDGLNDRDIAFGSAILIPSIDALQEFKLQTKTYSAEYGGSTNQIQLHFKSGTNSLHGTAYEFVRNNDFDARSFNEASVPRLDQNQFGYSLGGPIVIPRLYNGRNKSFFFANYEGFRLKANTPPTFIFVPTAAQWAGQFSTTIIDPLTQLPFPGNQVPADRVSQFAKAYQQYVPAPNSTSASGNFVGEAGTPTAANQQNYRFDQNLGENNSFFFRYSTSTNDGTSGAINGTGFFNQVTTQTQNHAYQISYTRVFSSRLVNQATYGYVYANFDTVAPTISATALSAFGVQGGFTPQPTPEIPNVVFSNKLSQFGVNSNNPKIDVTHYYNGADTLTLTQGNHSLSAGFSLLNWSRRGGNGANLGTWNFNGQYSGDSFADFLLGNPSGIQLIVPSPFAPTAAQAVFTFPQYTWSTFVNDQWKVSPRLTVNAGLRYEFYLPTREAQGRYMWFNFKAPGGGLCTSSQKAATDVGQSGLLQYCGPFASASPKLSFAPRLGIAYLPFEKSVKTVIRAGYGIFYDSPEEQDDANGSAIYPFLGSQAFNGTPVSNVLSTSMPIPAISTLRPLQKSDLGFTILGTPQFKRPYTQNWSLSIEHSPLKNTTVELGYQGSESTHYPTRYNLNQSTPYDPANPTPNSARLPYPNFGTYTLPRIYALSSNFNAGAVKVRHDSHSLVVIAAYTFSKSMDIRSGENGAGNNDVNGWGTPEDSRNLRHDYGPSTFDVKHHAVFSFVHNLRVGRGERYLSNASKPVNLAVGGWQVNGIVTLQTGFPFSVGAVDTNTLIGTFGQRADRVGNPYPAGFHKSAAHWFDTAAFAQPATGLIGNSGRNILRAPGLVNFDLSVIKNFYLSERLNFQFRAESFNTFNHTNYYVPDFSVQDGSAFGTISTSAAGRIIQLGGKLIF